MFACLTRKPIELALPPAILKLDLSEQPQPQFGRDGTQPVETFLLDESGPDVVFFQVWEHRQDVFVFGLAKSKRSLQTREFAVNALLTDCGV